MQHITGQQGTPGVPSKLPKSKSRFAAQIIRNLEASPNRQIGTTAIIHKFCELKYCAGFYRLCSPLRQRFTVQAHVHECAAYSDDAIAVEAQCRTRQRNLEPG